MAAPRRQRRLPPFSLAVALALALGAGGCAKVLGFDATLPEVDGGGVAFDGMTGQTCMGDADCRGPGGPGIDTCDLSLPTPVCRLARCNAPADGNVHYCDGPDVPTSPGVCLDDGTCWPKCTFQNEGSPAAGCPGKDACNATSFQLDPSTQQAQGIGFCRGGCDTDGDCSSGLRCQVDQGYCVAAPTSHDAPGTVCDVTASPSCNCFYAR